MVVLSHEEDAPLVVPASHDAMPCAIVSDTLDASLTIGMPRGPRAVVDSRVLSPTYLGVSLPRGAVEVVCLHRFQTTPIPDHSPASDEHACDPEREHQEQDSCLSSGAKHETLFLYFAYRVFGYGLDRPIRRSKLGVTCCCFRIPRHREVYA